MSVFDPNEQKSSLDGKIVAGLERLSQVFRALLWEQAKAHSLSPIQVQLLIFMYYHGPGYSSVSYLADEFSVTKPTISDAVKVLEQKKLISKLPDPSDNRRYSMQLTPAGEEVARSAAGYAAPFSSWLEQVKYEEKEHLWESIAGLIATLNRTGLISVQRTCFNCRHYVAGEDGHFCKLLDAPLFAKDIRIDCPEFAIYPRAQPGDRSQIPG